MGVGLDENRRRKEMGCGGLASEFIMSRLVSAHFYTPYHGKHHRQLLVSVTNAAFLYFCTIYVYIYLTLCVPTYPPPLLNSRNILIKHHLISFLYLYDTDNYYRMSLSLLIYIFPDFGPTLHYLSLFMGPFLVAELWYMIGNIRIVHQFQQEMVLLANCWL